MFNPSSCANRAGYVNTFFIKDSISFCWLLSGALNTIYSWLLIIGGVDDPITELVDEEIPCAPPTDGPCLPEGWLEDPV